VQSGRPFVTTGSRPAPRAPVGVTVPRLAIGFEAGLHAAALLFFPLLVLAPRGIAPLASIAGLFAGGLILSANGPPSRPGLAAPLPLLGALLIWGAVSATWSIDPLRSLDLAARLAGLFAAGLAMAVAAELISAPLRLTAFLVVGFILGIALATIDVATHGALTKPFSDRSYQITWLNQASVTFAILLLTVSVVMVEIGGRLAGLMFAAAAAATVYVLAATSAKVALAAGLPMAFLCYYWRLRAARAAALVSILVVITAPLTFARLERVSDFAATADAVKFSAGHRLLIWSFVGDRIAEHPLAGWGLDSSRAIPGSKDPIEAGATWLPLHPHNAPLQLWLELGVPGAVLMSLLAAGAWFALGRAQWPRLFAAAAGGNLTTGFVASFATYGIWQEWWQGTLWFSLFLVLVMERAATGGDEPRRMAQAR
jgi:exopolysaccharide production protein ExoQ